MMSGAVDVRIPAVLCTPWKSTESSDGDVQLAVERVSGVQGLYPGSAPILAGPAIAGRLPARASARREEARSHGQRGPRALRSPRGVLVEVQNPRACGRQAGVVPPSAFHAAAGPHRPEAPMPPARPTGTVTFLFTDVEGSTACWERQPEAMHIAHRRQEAILRRAIAQHGGYAYKMVGDAFQAAFQTAPQALGAALAAQRALYADEQAANMGTAQVPSAELDSPGAQPIPLTLALRVRMALHTGVTEERADDYFGPLLNRLSRLVDAAHGRQVLLTQATHDLLCPDLPDGVTLRDLGEQRLRDLIRPEHVFQLCARDLPDAFPRMTSPGLRVPTILAQWRRRFDHTRDPARHHRGPRGWTPRLVPAPERVGRPPGLRAGLHVVHDPAYLYAVSMYQ